MRKSWQSSFDGDEPNEWHALTIVNVTKTLSKRSL